MLRPFTLKHFILGFQHFPVVDHFIKNVRTNEAGYQRVAQKLFEQGAGIGLQNPFRGICQIDSGLDTIAVFDGADRMVNFIHMGIQMLFEGFQVIGTNLGKHLGNHLLFHNNSLIRIPCLSQRCTEG